MASTISSGRWGLSQTWHFKWRDRLPTLSQTRQVKLEDAIWDSFKVSGFTCGLPRVWLDLFEDGWKVSVNTIAAIMTEHHWYGRQLRKRRSLTKTGKRPVSPDPLGRAFFAARTSAGAESDAF